MARRRAAGVLLALAACVAYATAAPTASNHTSLDLYDGAPDGCYYNFQHYGEGDRIMTNEPCLNCTCHNRMLMCYLRVCPFTKPIGQDCTIEKRADQCCPIVTCPDVPVDLLTSTTNSPAEYGASGLGKLDKYGCSIHGKYFSEGSKVPPTPNKPCEHCYCIRNMTTCVMQECTLHVDGCTPIYHKDVCCPVRYSCDHPEDEMPLLDDLSTTVRPTPGFLLTTTTLSPVTQMSQDCLYENKIIPDGALIKTEKACDHCYCMKGDIVCVVQECGTPMENEGKNCTALPPREGVCCPDTYICEGDESSTGSNEEQSYTTEIYQEKLTTLTPPRRAGSEGSGYRIEPDDIHNTESPYDSETEGSGDEQATIHPTVASEMLPESHKIEPTDEIAISTEEPHEFTPTVSTVEPAHQYDEVTTVKDDHQELPEPQVTSTSTDLIPKEGDESTTVKIFDEDIGSGEDEIPTSHVTIQSSSILPAVEDSEPTVANKEDVATTESTKKDSFGEDIMTEIPSIEKETKVTISSDRNLATDIPIETTTQSRRHLDEEDTKTPTIIDAESVTTESDLSQTTTIVPIIESDARKTTQAVERESTTLYETDSKKPFDPEHYVTVSTNASGLEDEITTESQDIITDGIEGTSIDVDPNHHATVTASTPLLEEIEKETNELESIPHESSSDKHITSTTQLNIPLETVDENSMTTDFIDETISTTIPTTDSVPEKIDISTTESQTGHEKDSSEHQDQTDQESEITPTTQSGVMVTSEPQRGHDTFVEESSESQQYPSTTLAPVYEKEIKTTTEPDFFINIPERQTDDDTEQINFSHVTTLQQSEITTAEPDKGLNTIPSGTMEDETTESSEKEKTTSVDDKRIYDLTTELENKYNEDIDTVTESSIQTTLGETSVSNDDLLILTTKPAIKEVDSSKTETVHEVTEPTTKLSDIAETTLANHSSNTETSPLDHQESYTPAITETTDNLEQTRDSTKPTFISSYEPMTEAAGSDSDVTPSKLETSSYETISESTTVNLEENEIVNEPRIPGEGDCLLNGVTYRNESTVPNTNKCQSGCKCVSSIVKCDPIICSPPPKYMDNCHATYDSPNSCCPTYICDHKAETMPPQSHSQISGTESPATPPIKCHGDECVINEDQSVEITELCESGKCTGQSETGFSPPSHIPEQPKIDHKECVGEKCIQTTDEPFKPCEGNECGIVSPDKLKPCHDGEDCGVPVKECNGENCRSDTEISKEKPHGIPCEGNECGIVSDNTPPHQLQPCVNGEDCDVPTKQCQGDDCSFDTDKFEKKPQDQICENSEDCETNLDDIENKCTENSCKRKHDSEINQQEPQPCSGPECQPNEITPQLELTTASTLTSQKDLESDEVTDRIDTVTEISPELPSQDSDQSTKLIENVTNEPEQHEIVHADTDSTMKPDILSTMSSEITTNPEITTVNKFTTAFEEAELTESPLPHHPVSINLDEDIYQTEEPIRSTGIVTDKQDDIIEDNVMNISDVNNEQTTEISGEFITTPSVTLEKQEVTEPTHEEIVPIETSATKMPEQKITDDNEMFSQSTKTPLIQTSEIPSTDRINTESPPESIESDTVMEIIKQEEQHTVTTERHILTDHTKSSDDAQTTIIDEADETVTESSKPSKASQDVTIPQQVTEIDITTRRTIETDNHLGTELSNPDVIESLESTKSPDAFENENSATEISDNLDSHLIEKYTTPQSSETKDTVTEQFIATDSPLDLVTKRVTHGDVTAYEPSEDDKQITTIVPNIPDNKMPGSTEDETIEEDTKTEAPLSETKTDTTNYVSSTLKPTDYTDVSYSVDKATEHLETTTSPKEEPTETLETINEPSEEQQPDNTLIPVSISTEQPYMESETKLPIDSAIELDEGSHTNGPALDIIELSPTEPSVINITGTEEINTEKSVENTENENKLADYIPQKEDEGDSPLEKPTEEEYVPEITIKPGAEAHEHDAPVNYDLSTVSPIDDVEITEKPTDEVHESKTPVSYNLSTTKPADDVEITENPVQEVGKPETSESIDVGTESPEDDVDIIVKPVDEVQEPGVTVSDNLNTEIPVDEVKILEKPTTEDQNSGTHVSDHLSTMAPEDNVEITIKPTDVVQEPVYPVTDNLNSEEPFAKITEKPTEEPEAHVKDDLTTTLPEREVHVTEKPTKEVQETEGPVSVSLSTEAPVDEAKMTENPAEEEQEPNVPITDDLSTTAPLDEIIFTEKPSEGVQKPEVSLSDNVSSEVPVDENNVTEKLAEDDQAPAAPEKDNLSTETPLDSLTEKPVEAQESEAPISDYVSTTTATDEEKLTENSLQETQEPEGPLSDHLSTTAPKGEVQNSENPSVDGQESDTSVGDDLSTMIPEDKVEITFNPANQVPETENTVSNHLSTAVPADNVKPTENPTIPANNTLTTGEPADEVKFTGEPAVEEQEPEVPVTDSLNTIAPFEESTITEKPTTKAPTINDLSTISLDDEVKATEKPIDGLKQPENEGNITEKPTSEVESETPVSDHLSTAGLEDEVKLTENPLENVKETEGLPTESDEIEIETSTRRDGAGGVRTDIPDTLVNQQSTTEHLISTDIPKLVTETYIEDTERKITTESPSVTQEDETTTDMEIKTPPQGDLTSQSTSTESVQDFTKPQDMEGIKEIEAATEETDKMSTTALVFQSTEAVEVIETSTKTLEMITRQPNEEVPELEHTPKQENVETTTSGKIEDEHTSLIDKEETRTPVAVTDVTQAPLIDAATSKPETVTESSEEDLPSRTYRPESAVTTPEDIPEKQTDASVLVDDASVSPIDFILTSTESHTIGEDHHTTIAADKETTPTVEEQTKIETTPTQNQPALSSDTSAPEENMTTTKPTTPKAEKVTTSSPLIDRFTKPALKPTEVPATEQPRPIPTEEHPTDDIPTIDDEASVPPSGSSGYGQETDYVDEDPTFGPGTCRYGGKVYVSAQQIPRDDPCDFCFCFRSDIICLQQSCPPPIQGCHEEPIQGFCCPRYECPVSMATTVNVTTTTTTTTTTLPPHFPIHSYKGSAQKRGCLIKGHTYKVGEVVRASSGPCLHCTCGGDGQMKCDPKQCTPEPMLRQMIAAAVSAKRRR